MPAGVYQHKPNQGFQKNNKINFGKHYSEERKKKIGLANLGKKHPHTEETKKRISKTLIGIKRSKETRHKMSIANSGEKSHFWKGGQYNQYGYIYIYQPNHPFCNNRRCVKRSRLVMEKLLKRYIKPFEAVHHINGIKDDDREENLQLFLNHSEHQKFHHPKGIKI